MTRSNPAAVVGLVIATLLAPGQAKAGIVNGSFESFFNNWSSVGPGSGAADIAGVLPTDSNLLAHLSNGGGAVPIAALGAFIDDDLGLAPGTAEGLVQATYPNATEGAILYQLLISLGAGETGIEFDWNFLTNEPDVNPNNDFAFYGLFDGTTLVSSGSVDINNSTFIATPNGTPYSKQTGWGTVAINNLPSGNNYSLVFGVFDDQSGAVDSGLLIDNVTVVPEPSAALLLGLSALPGALIRRRRS